MKALVYMILVGLFLLCATTVMVYRSEDPVAVTSVVSTRYCLSNRMYSDVDPSVYQEFFWPCSDADRVTGRKVWM